MQKTKKLTALVLFVSIQLISLISWSATRVSVASWNVQNLFDSEHDQGKWDYAFLPKNHPNKESGCRESSRPEFLKSCLDTDWTREKVLLKYQQIKKMIQALPSKPDILVLVEIENPRVLNELAQIIGYSGWAISHWDDERGVDTGILFNRKAGLQFVGTKPVAIPLSNNLTRPILQAQFKVNSEDLHIYINHWPAAMAPEYQRALAATQIRKQIETENQMRRKPIFSVAVGDFNVTNLEFPRPLLPLYDPAWNYRLVDLDIISRQYGFKNPPGSYYYFKDKTWNMFDRVMVSGHFFSDQGLKIPINKFKIVDALSTSLTNQTTGQTVTGIPFRYNTFTLAPEKLGYSDHFPVYFELLAP